ncbi:Phospholipase A2 [Microbulbifer donghaiensis]|uniref:Phospholipase A2 n=1 Tax=Microbulbifer donghaiensis TaxID=494016 RepID=A0A1M5HCY5_9GAMM|nr:phospholipase A2 family protein [Microbulbifer donghaiensis]SHG13825.1 Phospholipase A2 [Microbulbifer donghaiensis]
MAKVKKKSAPSIEMVRRYLDAHRDRWLQDPNITSIGIGYKKYGETNEPSNDLCIQFTVKKKGDPGLLQAEGIATHPITPECTLEDGSAVPTDILEREYKPSWQIIERFDRAFVPEDVPDYLIRRKRNDVLSPGISVSNYRESAGTLGTVVYDNDTGDPMILSNWHVLQGDDGEIGDAILQPGPYDGGRMAQDQVGSLVRSHVGRDGDCAVCTIEDREYDETILGMDLHAEQVADPELGDKVWKSGRTTGVTHGIISRVDVVTKLYYGINTGIREIYSFEVEPDPDYPADRGEISMGGDSGSLWMAKTEDEERGIAIGLHFAGETNPSPAAEHAVACYIRKVLDKLNVSLIDPLEETFTEEELILSLATEVDKLRDDVMALEEYAFENMKQGIQTPAVGKGECSCGSFPNAVAGEAIVEPEGVKVYGNWCGPGHSGGTPVDAVDRVCMKHDRCYSKKGYLNCDCDRELVRGMAKAVLSRGVSAAGRIAGTAAATYFSAAPCVSYTRIAGKYIPVGGGTSRVHVGDIVNGGRSAYRFVKRKGRKLVKKIRNLF